MENTMPVKVIIPPEIVDNSVREVLESKREEFTVFVLSNQGSKTARRRAVEIYTAGIPQIRDCG
jgi:hypothetical protein